MGYRSNIRVMTDLEGFETMQDIIWEIAKEKNFTSDYVLFPEHGANPEDVFDHYDAQEDYLCFGFDLVKWYDDTYKDVILFMDMLNVANECGVQWQFIRTGEMYEDVEMLNSDNFYDNPPAVMTASVEINY